MEKTHPETKRFFLSRALSGQSVLEYAIILAVVSAAFLTMAMYVRRAVQGNLYKIEERISAKATE